MFIASSVAHETEGDDESPDPSLAPYNFEDKNCLAEHSAPLNASLNPAPNPPPKKKRCRKGSTSFRNKPKGRQ